MVALVGAALLALPSVAQATPQFHINGTLAGSATQNVVAYGTLTLDSQRFGEWKCKVIAGLAVRNESEKGVGAVEGWEPFDCSTPECPDGGGYVSPEAIELLEEEKPVGKEKYFVAKRQYRYGPSAEKHLPWPAELVTQETEKVALNMRKMRLWLVCLSEAFEVPYTGNLEPHFVNGVKNGLNPSRLRFEGKGSSTSYLATPYLVESPENYLWPSGELTMLGTGEELVSAE
jgi:hypothetical protein